MSRIYLHKNDLTKNPKLPYFVLKLIPEDGNPDTPWKTVGAFWKSASGKGYNGQLNDGVVLDASLMREFNATGVTPESQAADEVYGAD